MYEYTECSGLVCSVDVLHIQNPACVCGIVENQTKLFPHTATLRQHIRVHSKTFLSFMQHIYTSSPLYGSFKVMVLHHFDEEKYKSKVIFSLINFIECTVFEIYFLHTHKRLLRSKSFSTIFILFFFFLFLFFSLFFYQRMWIQKLNFHFSFNLFPSPLARKQQRNQFLFLS